MSHNNDNVIGSFKNNNDNNNGANRFARSRKVESIAMKLAEKMSSPGSIEFYLKVAWTLPEDKIWLNYEKSRSGKKNPNGLFNWLCRRDMLNGK